MTVLEYLVKEGKRVSAPCGGNGTCKGCLVNVKMPSGEMKKLLACQTEYVLGMEITVPEEIISVAGANEALGSYDAEGFVAVDIGTTTIAMALVDGKTGKILEEYGSTNSQRAYGSDVISRIKASNEGKKEELRSLVLKDIKRGLDKFTGDYEKIVVSGNTTMIHLLLGMNCERLGVFPFVPENLTPEIRVIAELSEKPIHFIPGISAFVGGDIVSGLLTFKNDGYSMLVDLGTNGEMVLWNEDHYFVTSASAGPAFEECRLSYGSETINELARLLDEGVIDESGLIEDEEKCSFSGEDIAKLQLAKSAIRTGIDLLMRKTSIREDEIKHLYISGGFGNHLSVKAATRIGLIPKELEVVCQICENTSLEGAIAYGLCADIKEAEAKEIIEKAIKVEIANLPEFNDLYASNMMFTAEGF